MAKSIKAKINSELLKWARESVHFGLAEAAKSIGTTPDRLALWEEGQEQITVAKLRDAARVYKRPLSVFFLPEPPKDFKAMKEFRRLPGVPEKPSTKLMQEFRAVAARREVAVELAQSLNYSLQPFEKIATSNTPPEIAAVKMRERLCVSLNHQRKWKTDYDAWNYWRAAVEHVGVLVSQMSGIEVEESRGFSAHYDLFPVVVVNTKDPPVARCFTLMHELGHLARQRGALCDIKVMSDVRNDANEVWCNAFAAEVLTPLQDFRLAVKTYPYKGAWPSNALIQLSKRYGVSQEVIYRRLLTAERTTTKHYQAWRASYKYREKSNNKPGFQQPPSEVVNNAGRVFVELVLSAYSEGRITASALSGHLGAKLKHLPRIQELVLSRRIKE